MATPIYLIHPDKILIYSFVDPKTSQESIFNAVSLSKLDDPAISEIVQIDGMVTTQFGVYPTVVGYDDGTYEVIYAVPKEEFPRNYKGEYVHHKGAKVLENCKINVPDLDKSNSTGLVPTQLKEPDAISTQRMIDFSYEGKEYSSSKKNTDMDISRKDIDKLLQRINDLESEAKDLRSILKALNGRIYGIYPVELPSEIRIGGKATPVVSYDEITNGLTKNEFERHFLDPLLQPYAGSHRSNNRLVTMERKDGSVCHVKADYDAKTAKINPPK